jgi:hypothetical protein
LTCQVVEARRKKELIEQKQILGVTSSEEDGGLMSLFHLFSWHKHALTSIGFWKGEKRSSGKQS